MTDEIKPYRFDLTERHNRFTGYLNNLTLYNSTKEDAWGLLQTLFPQVENVCFITDQTVLHL